MQPFPQIDTHCHANKDNVTSCSDSYTSTERVSIQVEGIKCYGNGLHHHHHHHHNHRKYAYGVGDWEKQDLTFWVFFLGGHIKMCRRYDCLAKILLLEVCSSCRRVHMVHMHHSNLLFCYVSTWQIFLGAYIGWKRLHTIECSFKQILHSVLIMSSLELWFVSFLEMCCECLLLWKY